MQTFTSDTMNLARRYWGMELVRGIAAIIFGLLAIFWPHLTFNLFIYMFGIYALIEGLILCVNGFSQSGKATPKAGTTYRSTLGSEPGTTYRSTLGSEGGVYRGTTTGESGTVRPTGGAYQPGVGVYQRVTGRSNWGALLVEGILSIICGLLALTLPGVVGRLVLYAVAAWAAFKGIGFLMQAQRRGWVMGIIGGLAIILALILFFNPLSIVRTFLWIVGVFSVIMGALLVIRGLQQNASTTRETRRPLEPTY